MMKLSARKQQPAPELLPSRPRPVGLTGLGILVASLGTLLPVAALVSGFLLYGLATRDLALRKAIQERGSSTTADVTGLSRTRDKSPRFNVAYRYSAGGAVHQGRGTIARAHWNRLQVGSTVTVRYLPEGPERSWIAGYEPRGTPFWVGPVVALALTFLSFLAWRTLRRQWMLLTDGRPATATVTRSKRVYTQHSVHYAVYYEFRTMSDSLMSGKYDTRRSPPEIGATISVVYDPDNPKRSGRYPFSLVRPVLSSQP